ncbi:MAG: 2-oxoglutarate dehydrogenase E1 component [Planctomycetota bacterium]|nr:MAG: 2-oxoglutarate dehydrogenase E1 component [Planctomycetota bacterium]
MSQTPLLPDSQNLSFIESLLREYVRDPQSVPPQWREYFRQLLASNGVGSAAIEPQPVRRSIFNPLRHSNGSRAALATGAAASLQDRVDQMVRAYRVRGHIMAHLDPLCGPRPMPEELDPHYYGFTDADLDRPCSSRTIKGPAVRSLREIITRLQNTYTRYIGVQFMHIDELDVRHWLQERMEGTENRCHLSRTQQFRILTRLTDAVIFEEFIQRKFVGAKSFSLEGAESLIPLLDLAIEQAGDQGIDEIVIAMAHRGRLNVLANIVGKSPRRIFREFQDLDVQENLGRGDVKYHLGYHGYWTTASGRELHIALCFNPSHLEYVNPVALGRMRAKQDRLGDLNRRKGLVIQIHGDAAFAGEGIVQETLQLSQLEGYRTGGSLHVIVNNQIGFTTSPLESRSSVYASAIGKMLQIPIFHVNGEDPESVAQVVKLAMEFRHEFQRDAIIDMYCYRRRGHNESDEPSFTQPLMYKAIKKRKSVRQAYLERLVALGGVTREAGEEIKRRLTERLEEELSHTRDKAPAAPKDSVRPSILGRVWRNYRGGPDRETPEVETGAPRERITRLLTRLTELPSWFHPHPKLHRILNPRREMAAGKRPLDWATAEAAAMATLATEGTRVRLSGQDSGRGTFSQRHAVLYDYETGKPYVPLQHLSNQQAPVEIYNSPLNEAGVMGFEYGYSVAYPDGLVAWEAQFGDFANVAQVIIDQFITSAEDKWGSLSGLVLLLPHGFEGQGPEHSSARPERFLQLAAEDNIQVCNLTTPANYFHCLRRQVLRPWRKPLVIMTPKSLLRHPRAVSSLDDLADGAFQRIIPDHAVSPGDVRSILMCTGKIYYELLDYREKHERNDTAIVRLEQIYPISDDLIAETLDPYAPGTPVTWVQEEPQNMGAWGYLKLRFGDKLCGRWPLHVESRPASASPATGSAASHKLEQQLLLMRAFGD